MEAAFNKLQKEGKNDVENLMKWIKDSKIIDQSKEQEEKLRSFFSDVTDQKNIPLDKFKEIMKKVSDEFKKNLEGITKQLAESGPKLLQSAIGGATSKLKDLMPKPKL